MWNAIRNFKQKLLIVFRIFCITMVLRDELLMNATIE